MAERTSHGHWLPGRSANPGGRPGVPEVIKARLRKLSPRAVERLGQLLDSPDERIQLEAARTILDSCLGRPAILADLTVNGSLATDHLQTLMAVARHGRNSRSTWRAGGQLRHAVPVGPGVVLFASKVDRRGSCRRRRRARCSCASDHPWDAARKPIASPEPGRMLAFAPPPESHLGSGRL